MRTNKSKETEFEFYFVTGTVLILLGIRLMRWLYNLIYLLWSVLICRIFPAVSVKKRILYEEESRLIFNAKCHEIKNQEFQTKLKCEQEYFSLLIFRTKGIMIFSGKNKQKAVQMRVLSYELKGILLVHKLISD